RKGIRAGIAALLGAMFIGSASPAAAQHGAIVAPTLDTEIAKLVALLQRTPDYVALISAHNQAAATWSQAELDARDARWRNDDAAIIDPVVNNALSSFLSSVVANDQRIAEIIVMGITGANIAVSSKTSDYWQGDEAKYQKTFGAQTAEPFEDRVEFDESVQTFTQQVSQRLDIAGAPAGAITVGFDIKHR
ncbi:MAG: hypothetical protein AAFO79_02210, partial [Pseudomonadota bacterium]